MANLIKRLLDNSQGNFAITGALVASLLLLATGMAVDYSRVNNYKSKLQDSADAAALATAIEYRQTNLKQFSSARKTGKDTFKNSTENLEKIKIRTIQVKNDKVNNEVTVTSSARLDPLFMQIFGYPRLDLSVTSTANIGSTRGAEIAFVVDGTNSMGFDNRWDTTMSSLEKVLTDLKHHTGSSNFFVSLVPFHDRVNVGTSIKRLSWFKGTIPATPAPNNWIGCAHPREETIGAFNWALDDDKPTGASRFEYSTKHDDSGVGQQWWGASCGNEITGPTNNISEIITAAKAMTNQGSGRIDVGLAWGWRILSPKWRNKWGQSDYPALNTEQRKKYLVFVSDGNSRTYGYEMDAAIPPSWPGNMGSPTGFAHFEDLCERIKDDGIEIYILQIEGNPKADKSFETCASSPKHHNKITDVEDVQIAFNNILRDFETDLRIVN